MPQGSGFAYLAHGSKLILANLDTGEIQEIDMGSEILAYNTVELASGGRLLSFIDDSLTEGFVVVDEELNPRIAVMGASAYPISRTLLLEISVSSRVPEDAIASSVNLWSVESYQRLYRLENTTPLPPLAFLLDVSDRKGGIEADTDEYPEIEAQSQPQNTFFTRARFAGYIPEQSYFILATYELSVPVHPIYPFTSRYKFLAIESESGNLLWQKELQLMSVVAELENLYQDDEFILLAGAVDYDTYLYLCLSAKDGSVLWQKRSSYFPRMENIPPYEGYTQLLAVTVSKEEDKRLIFPSFNATGKALERLSISLADGKLRPLGRFSYEHIREIFLELYEPPQGSVESSKIVLGNSYELMIEGGTRVFLQTEEGSRAVKPTGVIGSNIQLYASGEKLAILVEEPLVINEMGAQGNAFILEIPSAKIINPEEPLKLLRPVRSQEGLIVLTKENIVLTGAEKTLQHPLSFQRR